MVQAQKRKYRSTEQDGKPTDKPTHIWSPNLLTKESRTYSGGMITSSISGARKTGQLYVKE